MAGDDRRAKQAGYQRTYRQNHPERVKATNRAYYEKNRAAIQTRLKANRDAGGDAVRGSMIRAYRQSLGMSQQQFAAVLGTTQATLSLWENGKIPVNLFIIDAAFPELGDQLRTEERN